jgi:uncharacterized protein (TIGR02145 family)
MTATGDLPIRLIKAGMDTTVLSAHYVIHNEIPWTYSSYGTFRDPRDGQTYRTTGIGGQTWMANNLNYVGTATSPIGTGISDTVDYSGKYGRLYTWTEALALPATDSNVALVFSDSACCSSGDWSHTPRQGICPAGWHVPSGAEMFDTLMATLQQYGKTCTDLEALNGWTSTISPIGNSFVRTDAVGMRVLPSGNGFWFSSESANDYADMLGIGNGSCRWSQYNSKSSTASIRCIKN